jgi:hypothetical protein
MLTSGLTHSVSQTYPYRIRGPQNLDVTRVSAPEGPCKCKITDDCQLLQSFLCRQLIYYSTLCQRTALCLPTPSIFRPFMSIVIHTATRRMFRKSVKSRRNRVENNYLLHQTLQRLCPRYYSFVKYLLLYYYYDWNIIKVIEKEDEAMASCTVLDQRLS